MLEWFIHNGMFLADYTCVSEPTVQDEAWIVP